MSVQEKQLKGIFVSAAGGADILGLNEFHSFWRLLKLPTLPNHTERVLEIFSKIRGDESKVHIKFEDLIKNLHWLLEVIQDGSTDALPSHSTLSVCTYKSTQFCITHYAICTVRFGNLCALPLNTLHACSTDSPCRQPIYSIVYFSWGHSVLTIIATHL